MNRSYLTLLSSILKEQSAKSNFKYTEPMKAPTGPPRYYSQLTREKCGRVWLVIPPDADWSEKSLRHRVDVCLAMMEWEDAPQSD